MAVKRYGAVKRLLWGMVILLLMVSACTLDSANTVRENSLHATQTAIPVEVSTISDVSGSSMPSTISDVSGSSMPSTISDISGSSMPSTSAGIPPTPVLQSNQTATNCGKLRVMVGTDPGNTLRLREQPNNNSNVILLIPNNSLVTKVPASQEINAGGYNWVNIQYTDPNGVVVTGWAARDAMRNQATLRAEGC